MTIEVHNANITTSDSYAQLTKDIQHGSKTPNQTRVDLVIACVDNYTARMTINSLCNSLNQIWIESGVSEDALNCHFQMMIPGETACFACMPPLALVEGNEANIKREGVCTASLPTTMGITAGFIAQTVLKLLLQFEEISYYLSYNSRNEFFSKDKFIPNPECKDANCVKNQKFIQENPNQQFLEKRNKSPNFIKNSEVKKPHVSKVHTHATNTNSHRYFILGSNK